MTDLFSPVRFGSIECKNRIIMAPLTRARAGESRIPNDLMVTYYAQRAGAGLIVSEATGISPMGYGWANAPAMYEDAHVEGWKKVTAAVHDAGGKIVLQLWHMGSLSHPDFHDGDLPVAPSEVTPTGDANTPEGKKPYVEPRALRIEEIKATVQDYVAGAARAMAAGFDGVEIHGANGYLIDQFLKDGTNTRTDAYGGSIENRCRFAIEVVEAVTAAIGADKVGIRLSPNVPNGGIKDSDPLNLFIHLAGKLNEYDLAFVHIHEGLRNGEKPAPWVSTDFRKAYKGRLILNGGYDQAAAEKSVSDNDADAIAFGKLFIANPDLPKRFEKKAELNKPQPQTFYGGGAEGYTDYPALSE
jgi:N-ethylmaleimide reductase